MCYLSVLHDFSIEENSLAIDFLQPGTVYHNIIIILSFGPCEFWNRSREQESARFSLKGIDFLQHTTVVSVRQLFCTILVSFSLIS